MTIKMNPQFYIQNGLLQITLYLKQGFYNYKYIINDKNKNLELANFWQTENEHTCSSLRKKTR